MKPIQPAAYLKLPFHFDENKMREEVETLLTKPWTPHFNTRGYEGSWNSISLYAPKGDAKNIMALQNENVVLTETTVLKEANYLKEVLSHFKAPFLSVRLLRLAKGAFIKPHRDYALGYEDGCFRLHIPIITHNDIEFILDDTRLKMLSGECWYTNVNYIHSVANKGNTDRIHLVIDLKRNYWSDTLFFSLAPRESFYPAKKEESYSPETTQRILEELKRIDTPAAKELIAKMEKGA